MTNPKWTPGPWFVHDFTEAVPSPSVGDVTVSCDHPATITVASMGQALTATLEEARANARLIAVVTEFADLAGEVIEYFAGTDAPLGQKARALLARARGEP